jgi:hypothetical protein
MGRAIAQVVLGGLSGLPEDRFINTFAFNDVGEAGDGPGQLTLFDVEDIAGDLIQFYNGGVAGTEIATFLSNRVSRLANACEVRVYDLDEAEPREAHVTTFQLSPSGFATNAEFPGEVAIAASYYSGRNIPRQRGRIYIGPLSIFAAGSDDAGQVARPDPNLLNSIVDRMATLRDRAGVGSWSVWSRAKDATVNKDGSPNPARPHSLYVITDVWVDNEFDTQRRRGAKATSRITNP